MEYASRAQKEDLGMRLQAVFDERVCRTAPQAQQTEKAIIRQGAEESSCKQVCCHIEDPTRSHQAGQDSVRLSSVIEFQQLDPRAIQKQIA
ncbi:hypothetical protein NDU88_002632 [Pleurodeles waltl]|uniref:Uncharacterized protein n=1 Tax=Pleurodeles waltl TaxID=8319 RepID=A0AAV7VBU9_PLEWA|nr:hypothetical protein NDU88_002632 [Pleurodeles waltl]